MSTSLRVVHVEDTAADCELAMAMLERQWPDLEFERVETEAAFRRALSREPDLVIADIDVPGFGAMSALRILADDGARIPLLIYSGAISPAQLDECVRLGAAACLLKHQWAELVPTVNSLLHPQLIASP
jgi:CheY-like chemotaxis protein